MEIEKSVADRAFLERAKKILSEVKALRALDAESSVPGKVTEWQRLFHEVRDIVRDAGVEPALTFVSPLERAKTTADNVNITTRPPKTEAPKEVVPSIHEIHLGPEMVAEDVRQAEVILSRGASGPQRKEALDAFLARKGMAPSLTDSPASRALLADPDHVFEGGEANRDYAKRVIKGYTSILLCVAEGNVRPAEEIAAGLEDPEDAYVNHVMDVQARMNAGKGGCPEGAFREELVYAPLAGALEQLDGVRLEMLRHGNTVFSGDKILTGGHIDTGLTSQGFRDSMETGIVMQLHDVAHPCEGKRVQIVGHSAASAVFESALCVSLPDVEQTTNGAYKVAEPHVIELGKSLHIKAVSAGTLQEELEARLEKGQDGAVAEEAKEISMQGLEAELDDLAPVLEDERGR